MGTVREHAGRIACIGAALVFGVAPSGGANLPSNLAPVVQAGPNQVLVGSSANLSGSVSDDGPLADVTTTWTQVSGPGPVELGDPAALETRVGLPGWGTYVLRLTADDGIDAASDEVAITVVAALDDLRAFPEAEGFGARAVGGRGGRVVEVTTLADSGPGSLRAAVDAAGPRTVVFRVGGTIWLETGLELVNPYITIAGHTAPGSGGITLANAGSTDTALRVLTHDVVLRHLHVRPGPGGDPDAISIERGAAYNVIVDHCSISWGVDENISTYRDAHHVTVQWSIVSEALDCSTHPDGCHSKGMLLGSEGGHSVSVHHNLFAHNIERNPRISSDGVVDVVNNVVYNPGFHGSWGPSHVASGIGASIRVNYVGNYYEPGVDSGSADWLVSAGGTHEIYLEQNRVPVQVIRPSELDQVVAAPHPADPVTTTSPETARDEVLASAGASLALACDGTLHPRRDPVDARIVADVVQGTGAKIDDPSQVGGYPASSPGVPCADTDRDGLPDPWETQRGLDPLDPDDAAADPDGDGYTPLEDYLNGEVAAPEVEITSPADGSTFAAGEAILFEASASDAQGADLTPGLAWFSDADGAVGGGGSFSATLTPGAHTVSAEATDADGLTGWDAVGVTVEAPGSPTVQIGAPPEGATFLPTDPIAFLGTASDPEDGDVTASLVWTSSLEGAIGVGGAFSRALTPGDHTIAAVATDADGATGADQVTIQVTAPPNGAPEVSITTPSDGTSVASGQLLAFAATAADPEEGDVASSLLWNSSLDGPMGAGGGFVGRLTAVGVHAVTATARDAAGLEGSDQVRVEVHPALRLGPSDDATTDSRQPNTPLGAGSTLDVRGHNRQTLESYLKFSVAGVTGPVRSARLRLQLRQGKAEDVSVYRVSNLLRGSSTPWTEAALTWNNRPELLAANRLGAGQAGLEAGWLEIDVSTEISGDGVYSFGLGTAAKSLISCDSKEAAAGPPELVIELEAP